MKRFISVLVLSTAVLTGCTCDSCTKEKDGEASVKTSSGSTDGTRMVSLSVTNMMCEQGCASHVKDLLASAPGVNSAEVDFAKKSATLEVGTGFDESKTLAMLEKAGYPSSLATPQ